MKKYIGILLFILFATCTILLSPANAQEPETATVSSDMFIGSPGAIFGQDHFYTVTLRGNGEAVVNMKAVFTNYEEASTSAITFEIPRVNLENVGVYQVVREKECIQFEAQKYDPETREYIPSKPQCTGYREPDYYAYYYGNTKYYRADSTLDGDKLTVQLPQEIGPQKSGSIILYYRAQGYVSKGMFGAYKYNFETIM